MELNYAGSEGFGTIVSLQNPTTGSTEAGLRGVIAKPGIASGEREFVCVAPYSSSGDAERLTGRTRT